MNKLKTRIIIIAVFVAAAALRMYDIEQKNLWFDEVYSWKISQGTITGIVSETSGDIHPPFYYIVLKYWIEIFSDSVFSMRLLSTILSLLSMYFIYRISKLFIENDFRIILVLLLYAVSPLNIYYSQEVRMLNLNLFLCLGSVYYFLALMGNDKSRNISLLSVSLLYISFTILAVYTHYFAFLIFFTELITALIYYFKKIISKKYFIRFILLFALINFLYLPWFPVFFAQASKGQPWRTAQSVIKTGYNLLDYIKDIFFSPYLNFESSAALYFSDFISILIVTFLIYVLFRTLNPKQLTPKNQNSLLLFFFVPLITATIISLRQSIVLSRYLSIIIPYLYIILVYYSYLYFSKRTATVFIVFLILISCYGTSINYSNDFKNNDYRKIISYIEKDFHQDDKIIAEPHFMGWSLNYYKSHSNTVINSPVILGWDLNMQLDSLSKRKDMKNIWFILDYSSLGKDDYDSLTENMNKLGYEKKSEKSFYLIPSKVKVGYFVNTGIP